MKSALKKMALFSAWVGISGLAGCVSAQQQRQADIGPGTFPRAQPDSTPNADRPAAYPMPNKNPGIVASPTPRKGAPPIINQSTSGQSTSEPR